MSFDAREFRDALSSFATGVTIITARNALNEPVGMTCSSFNSVSMDPPLILWSVTKTARSADAFVKAEHFAVHVLAFDQTDISNRFAKSGADKFGETDHHFDQNDVPILGGTASRFDCKQFAVHDGGDHWIILGEVLGFDRSKKEGLVFAGGSYATASPIQPSRENDGIEMENAPVNNLLFFHLSRAFHQVASLFHAEVRATGLTLPEWRILAVLFGEEITHSVPELAKRSFVRPPELVDMLVSMELEGLCKLDGNSQNAIVSGTAKGNEKIAHLFELDSQMESNVFGKANQDDSEVLFKLLNQVINKTQ